MPTNAAKNHGSQKFAPSSSAEGGGGERERERALASFDAAVAAVAAVDGDAVQVDEASKKFCEVLGRGLPFPLSLIETAVALVSMPIRWGGEGRREGKEEGGGRKRLAKSRKTIVDQPPPPPFSFLPVRSQVQENAYVSQSVSSGRSSPPPPPEDVNISQEKF